MKYDILATGYKTSRAKTIVIRQLAHDPSFSLQKATELVEAGPVILFKNLDVNEVKSYTQKLTNIGVLWKAVEIKHDKQTQKENKSQAEVSSQHAVLDINPYSIQENEHKQSETKTQLHNSHISNVIISNPNLQLKGNTGRFALEPDNKNPLPTVIFISLLLLIIIGIVALDRFKQNEIRLKKMTIHSKDQINSQVNQNRNVSGIKNNPKTSNTCSRKDISNEQKTVSSAMVDSAIQVKNDFSKEIYFYKMAVSFNRYNIHAWYGLLNTYRDAKMEKEMSSTIKEMKEIFGDGVFSINEIIHPYGNLTDAQLDKEGNYLIEYNTEKAEKDDLIDESYILIREIRQVCNCKNISLFAKTGPGQGLVVHISSSDEISSSEQYKNSASITYLK
jgi:hypothetical protein